MCRLLFSAAASVKYIGKWRIIAAVFSKTKGLKMSTVQYRRVLLKLSGESLMGKDPFGINRDTIMQTARQIKEISDLGVEIAIAAATFSAACPHKPAAWTGPLPTIWVCWPRS